MKISKWGLEIFFRVRTILVLGYWVLGNIHRYWIVLLLGDIFCCSDTQYNTNQTAVSTVHMPVNDYLVPLLTCSLTDAIICPHTMLFIKHNHCHHHRVLRFSLAIAMLYTSISIGIGYWYHSLEANIIGYWILGAFLGIVLTLIFFKIHEIYVTFKRENFITHL